MARNFSHTRLATKQEFLESDRCSGSVFEALEPGESIQLAEGVFTLDEDLDIPAAPTWQGLGFASRKEYRLNKRGR